MLPNRSCGSRPSPPAPSPAAAGEGEHSYRKNNLEAFSKGRWASTSFAAQHGIIRNCPSHLGTAHRSLSGILWTIDDTGASSIVHRLSSNTKIEAMHGAQV